MKRHPRIAITMGDPAGVGPEIIAGSWLETTQFALRFVVGCPFKVDAAIRLKKLPLQTQVIESLSELSIDSNVISVWPIKTDCRTVEPGQINAIGGQAAGEAVTVATGLALSGDIDALVTAPLHKESLHLAGYRVPGHTELLGELCGANKVAMMLYLPPPLPSSASLLGLGVVHVTLHTALRNVFIELTQARIVERCELATRFVRSLIRAKGLNREARIGVAALNPHGGESGLFGDEEIRIVRPAVIEAQKAGLPVSGPYPCDTLMHRAANGEFDSVVAMYHDQGHIALKLLGLQRAVNVTLGLPIVRTSVAHGTAFDIAWQNRAQHGSMCEAIRLAAQLATQKK